MRRFLRVGIAALTLMAWTLPAYAKIEIGGILFTDVYYLDRDKENADFSGVGDGKTSYTVTALQIPNISRFYGRWTNEDGVGMYIELGLGQGEGDTEDSSSDGVNLRHAYGWWDVNSRFQILAGKTTTPFSPLNPSQLLGTRSGSLNIIGVGYGDFYSGRFAQVRGTVHFCKYARLAVALVDPNGSAEYEGDFGPWDNWWLGNAQNNTKMPRIDIGLPIYAGPVRIYPSFMYQRRSVDISGNPGVDTHLNTYVGSLGFALGYGPFALSGEGNWGKNWGNTRGLIGNSLPAILSSAFLNPFTNRIHNAETYSFWFDVSYKLGPVTPHLIYGEMKSKNQLLGYNLEAKSTMWGFSIPIDLAKGFRLRPEFMWYDDGDLKYQDLGSLNYGKYAIYGVQFQISF
ncbi:MAG: hypothetical protein JRL30_20760 [Deltaproteobacteria bacterium]|nr:hypothetical protein [Deltaproteobacteria bacterium]